MAGERPQSRDSLEFIRRCVRERKILWTHHVNMRMRDRAITRAMILDSTDTYEIIEANPDDRYLPSFLVYSKHGDTIFHVLVAVDMSGDNVRIVTAYRPNPGQWEEDMKTRRKS